MRIVHLGKYYPPDRGGIERVVETICRGLVSAALEGGGSDNVTAVVARC